MNNSSFIGYDIVDDFIFEAKKNYPNAEWKCSGKLARETDYLFISGKNSGSLLTEIKKNNALKTNNLEKVFEKRLMNEKV